MTQARPADGPRVVQTHSEAVEQFRRPFGAGAIGFRILRQLTAGDVHRDGAVVVAPYVRAQSVVVRLNNLVPGRWAMRFDEFQLDLNQIGGGARLFLICRLTVTLPREAGGPDVDVTYEDIGEADTTVRHPVKALYSDARKRAAAAAGIGTYLYTVVPETTLPADGGHVARAADGEPVLTASAVRGLRERYKEQVSSSAIATEFGETLQHGESDECPADPDQTGPVAAAPPAGAAASPAASTDEPAHEGAETDEADSLGGWGNGRPTPPPAPVMLTLTRDGSGAAAVARPAPEFRVARVMSADQLEEICHEADRAKVSGSALANIVREAGGKAPLDEEAAAREFDSGLLNRTPDALLPKVLAAIRARSDAPAAETRPAEPAAADGVVPLDFGVLADDGT